MIGHRTRLRLYDYLEGTLSAEDRQSVERHLARCARCTRDLAELRDIALLLTPQRSAHEQAIDAVDWDRMVDSIVRATTVLDRHNAARRSPLSVRPAMWLHAHRGRAALGGAVALAAVLLVMFLPRTSGDSVIPPHADAGMMADSIVNERVNRYLRTSRVLLTELANVSPDRATGDMTSERRASRTLLAEARYLRRQPLDEYSAGVISDVERIMLNMANLPDQDPKSALNLIQEGVDHRNLLFRVRMAEQAYRSRTMRHASGARKEGIR